MKQEYLECIVDNVVTSVCRYPAGVSVHRVNRPPFTEREGRMGLTTFVQGDYKLVLHLLLDKELCGTIAANMNREPVSDPVFLLDCLREFFNILCGQIVSAYNKKLNASARFHVPAEIPPEKFPDIYNGTLHSACYDCNYGSLELLYLPQIEGNPIAGAGVNGRKGTISL